MKPPLGGRWYPSDQTCQLHTVLYGTYESNLLTKVQQVRFVIYKHCISMPVLVCFLLLLLLLLVALLLLLVGGMNNSTTTGYYLCTMYGFA